MNFKKIKKYLWSTFLFNVKTIVSGGLQLIRYYPKISSHNKLSFSKCLQEFILLNVTNRLTLKEFLEFGMYNREMSHDKLSEYLPWGLQRKFFLKTFNEHYDILLNNKKIFKELCATYRIPTATMRGAVTLHKSDVANQAEEYFEGLLSQISEYPIMLKPIYGLSGRSIFKIIGFNKTARKLFFEKSEMELESFVKIIRDSEFDEYLFEDFVQQHHMLQNIFPKAVNSIRVQTFINGSDVHIAGAMLKIGTGENYVDNVGRNQFVSLVNLKTGLLMKTIKLEGHTINDIVRGNYIRQQDRHPETNAQITGLIIPFWPEVKDLAVMCSKCFSMFRSIGWDIAVTEDGPLALEGNVDWTAKYQQMLGGGIYRDEIREIIDSSLSMR